MALLGKIGKGKRVGWKYNVCELSDTDRVSAVNVPSSEELKLIVEKE